MPRIDFEPPVGLPVKNAKLEDIIDLVRTRGEDYWNSWNNTGMGILSYHRGKVETASLIVIKRDGYGFHLVFREYPHNLTTDFFAEGCDDYRDVTELHLSGNLHRFPRALFVTEKQAEKVVTKFFSEGKRHRGVKWIPMLKLKWDIGSGRLID